MSKASLHIAALGSSFAAGPGILPISNTAAGRSSKNYASILASLLNARLTDLTVSGATLQNVLNEPQQSPLGPGSAFEPQLNALPSDVDIITLTGGGNDMGYISAMMSDEVDAAPWAAMLKDQLPERAEPMSVEEVCERFVAVIERIRKVAPRARVLLVEYSTLLGEDVRVGRDVAFSEDKVATHRKVAETLGKAYRLAAERTRCEVVPIGELSWEHGLGAKEPWVEGLSMEVLTKGKTPFHPNAEGMKAVADILYERLKDDFAASG